MKKQKYHHIRGDTIRQKAYCDIKKNILRYILYLYFSLLLFSIHDCALTINLAYKNTAIRLQFWAYGS